MAGLWRAVAVWLRLLRSCTSVGRTGRAGAATIVHWCLLRVLLWWLSAAVHILSAIAWARCALRWLLLSVPVAGSIRMSHLSASVLWHVWYDLHSSRYHTLWTAMTTGIV